MQMLALRNKRRKHADMQLEQMLELSGEARNGKGRGARYAAKAMVVNHL